MDPAKHFNKVLSDQERQAIMTDFPKPLCDALALPEMDEEITEQLKSRRKDPHFNSERCPYQLQDQVLDVADQLICLWADMLNKEAKVNQEDTLLLIQRALVLLGSILHQISLERRRVAWSKINPKLKSLAEGDYIMSIHQFQDTQMMPKQFAKWLKELLREAGVDTATFSAHSTRGALKTEAVVRGVATQDILKMADWSSESTFKQFYYRLAKDVGFAKKVLDTRQVAEKQ